MDIRSQSKAYTRLFDQQVGLYENYARTNGMVGKSLFILMWIYYSPKGVTQGWICKKTYTSKQVVNATIKKWMDQGYVMTEENPKDKRHKLLRLTQAGQAFASALLDPLESVEQQAMESLSFEERDLFLGLYQKYSQAIAEGLEGLAQDQVETDERG